MIDTEMPAGEDSSQERLMPMPSAGLFYGIQLKTEDGKKMAASISKLGEPYFVQ